MTILYPQVKLEDVFPMVAGQSLGSALGHSVHVYQVITLETSWHFLIDIFLAPIGAQGILIFVRLFFRFKLD